MINTTKRILLLILENGNVVILTLKKNIWIIYLPFVPKQQVKFDVHCMYERTL